MSDFLATFRKRTKQKLRAHFGEFVKATRLRHCGPTWSAFFERARNAGVVVRIREWTVRRIERGQHRSLIHDELRLISAGLGEKDLDDFIASFYESLKRNKPPVDPLFGRDRLRKEAVRLLVRSANRVITLTGLPGAGKTRLAQAIIADQAVQSTFATVIVYVELSQAESWSAAVSKIAHKLSEQFPGFTGKHELANIISYIGDQPLLLVLDSIDRLAPKFALGAKMLLDECPNLKVLITSCYDLHPHVGLTLPVPPLPVPGLLESLKEFKRQPAIQLFAHCARQANHRFAITSSNRPHVAAICIRLAGLPLAIRLVATRLRLFSSAEKLLAHLVRQDGKVNWEMVEDRESSQEPRQLSLKAAIQWVFDGLPSSCQDLLSRVTVFVAAFSLKAAEAVTPPDGSARPAVLTMIEPLVASSLLEPSHDGVADQQRWQMLDPIRQFAAEQLPTSLLPRLQRLHMQYFHRLVIESRPYIEGMNPLPTLKRLTSEEDDLRLAFRTALTFKQNEAVWSIAWSLSVLWSIRGRAVAETEVLEKAAAQGSRGGSEWRLAVLDRLILAYTRYPRFAKARTLGARYLTLSRRLGKSHHEATALCRLGNIARFTGRLTEAKRKLGQSLAMFRRHHNMQMNAWGLFDIGMLYVDMEQLIEGEKCLAESVCLHDARGDLGARAVAMTNLAFVRHQLDRPEDAWREFETAYEELRTHNPHYLGWSHHFQARAWLTDRRTDKARHHLRSSLLLFKEAMEPFGLVRSLLAVGWLATQRADFKTASLLFSTEQRERARLELPAPPDWKNIRDDCRRRIKAASTEKDNPAREEVADRNDLQDGFALCINYLDRLERAG